jgi:hypothetical protein
MGLRLQNLPVGADRADRKRLFTRLSEIHPEGVQWLWQDRLPLGEISVVDGDPATNKSSAILDLVARVSTRRPMPDARWQPGRPRRGVVAPGRGQHRQDRA